MLNVQDLEPQYITNEQGKKTSVIIPIDAFQELMEDMEDLAAAAERREEPSINHEDLIEELKKDGLV